MTAYPKHDAALAYAIAQIGVHETPDGSNRGPIQHSSPVGGVDYFEDHDFLAGHGYPWCASFCQTVWAEGAKQPLPYRSAGAYDLYNWAARNKWARHVGSCVPGDLVVFNVGSGHIAVLEQAVGTTVRTVDGNSGNQVRRNTRSTSVVRGGIHIPENPVVSVKPPEPFWLITTSETGHRKVIFSKFATEKTVRGMLPRLLARYGRNGFTVKRGKVRKA